MSSSILSSIKPQHVSDVLKESLVADPSAFCATVESLRAVIIRDDRVLPEEVLKQLLSFLTFREVPFGDLPIDIQQHILETKSNPAGSYASDKPVLFEIQCDVTIFRATTMEFVNQGPLLSSIFPCTNIIELWADKDEDLTYELWWTGYQGTLLYEEAGFDDAIVPFLWSFPKLEQVELVCDCSRFNQLLHEDETAAQDHVLRRRLPMDRLVHTICDAYESGDLPSTVKVDGLRCFCPSHHQAEILTCPLCRRVFETFPIQHLLEFRVFPDDFVWWPCDFFDAVFVNPYCPTCDILSDDEAKLFLLNRPGFHEALDDFYQRLKEESAGDDDEYQRKVAKISKALTE